MLWLILFVITASIIFIIEMAALKRQDREEMKTLVAMIKNRRQKASNEHKKQKVI